LRYFVLSSDGSGFRYIQLILERLGVKPKVFMINNELFYVDILEDYNKDIILYPDRFMVELSSFYYSVRLHQWLCNQPLPLLKDLYCSGNNDTTGAAWIPARSISIPTTTPIRRATFRSAFRPKRGCTILTSLCSTRERS